jgi:hypothetical protein
MRLEDILVNCGQICVSKGEGRFAPKSSLAQALSRTRHTPLFSCASEVMKVNLSSHVRPFTFSRTAAQNRNAPKQTASAKVN